MGWLKNLVDQNKQLSRMGQIPAHQHFMFFGNKADEDVGLPEVWKENGHINLKWLKEHSDRVIGTVRDLPRYPDKAIIFVGMSPILNRSWKYLKDAGDRFIIVATNSSAEYLGEKGIIPDYVILIDGKSGMWTMDLGPQFKDVTAIFSVFAAVQAFDQWPGKIMIVPYKVKDKNLNAQVKKRYGEGIASGGNSINSAVAIFSLFTDAKIMLFAGMELSFKKYYYADRPNPNDDCGFFYAKNVFGEKVRTLIPLFEYKVWLENLIAQMWPEYHFCNCSEGILGVDIDGSLLPCISQKRLDFAIQDIKEAWNLEETEGPARQQKLIYDKFYEEEFGNTMRGKGVWQYAMQFLQWEKGLDVGCGRANGVEWARKQGREVFGCDISETVQKDWADRGVLEYCRSCYAKDMPYADNEFDMIVCSEVMEHIPEADTLDTLRELIRVGSDKFFFTIALAPEKLPIAGYIQTHITIRPPEWWCDCIVDSGLKIVLIATNTEQTDLSIYAVKDDNPYVNGIRDFSKAGEEFPVLVLGDTDKPSPWAHGFEF